ncbi:hypothetical protein BT93_L3570 [Corymbia citriodora subsp. variegata]|uniref:RING-type E3 ubiquitin transferase n=1 Tax=Corymbia citriodora subsp. variegata TaxID=360336 RepID=A0A8T0CHD1_CORYI|nr:hypothetical protein BT93_L3570 [Corymbia citriodora subsp. variegata]
MEPEEGLELQLQELQKQLVKKQKFEESVSSIKSILQRCYPSASPSLRQSIYSVVCQVAKILNTRYTAPGFLLAGLELFKEAESLVSHPSEKEHLKSCIAQAREQLHIADNPTPESTKSNATRALIESRGYLFEGHLPVDREPPWAHWLVQSDLLNTVSMPTAAESSHQMEDPNMSETDVNLILELMNNLDMTSPEILDNIPASKEVVAKLPVITLSEEILVKMGCDAECAICKENLVVNDEMQELPCKHMYHLHCLKPWLDEHNSCPICRYELQTDDHAYES